MTRYIPPIVTGITSQILLGKIISSLLMNSSIHLYLLKHLTRKTKYSHLAQQAPPKRRGARGCAYAALGSKLVAQI